MLQKKIGLGVNSPFSRSLYTCDNAADYPITVTIQNENIPCIKLNTKNNACEEKYDAKIPANKQGNIFFKNKLHLKLLEYRSIVYVFTIH